jgi:dTDP-4-amino-4,6-dideoxygalactose transaminase
VTINVARPHIPDRKNLQSYLDMALDTRWLTNNGPLVRELTSRLEDFLGVRNLLLLSNATMGLLLAYRLLELKKPVVTTPFSFPATTSSLLWSQLEPVYGDIDAATFNLSASTLNDLENRSAILATHVFGNPCDVAAIKELGAQSDIPIIYDAAAAFGVELSGESLLNWGDISILSFHATKIFHCIEGGALVIQDDELFEKAKSMINFGYNINGEISHIGINAKMNDFEAAMGLAILDEIDIVMDSHKHNWLTYKEKLNSSLKGQKLHNEAKYNYSYYPIRFSDEKLLHRAVKALEGINVFPRRYFYPSLDTVSAYGRKDFCLASNDLASKILCLPLYTGLQEEEIINICAAVNGAVET